MQGDRPTVGWHDWLIPDRFAPYYFLGNIVTWCLMYWDDRGESGLWVYLLGGLLIGWLFGAGLLFLWVALVWMLSMVLGVVLWLMLRAMLVIEGIASALGKLTRH